MGSKQSTFLNENKSSVAEPENILRPGAGAGAEIILLLNIFCGQFGGY